MERKESVIHSVHITKIELHRGKEPECFYASGFISFEFMHSLCRTNYTEERRRFSYETTSVNINGALCDLQKILPEWEAVIIQEIAYEQSLNGMMRYVIGKAIIITYNTIDTLDLSMLALQRTRKILANANFDAMMNY